MDPNVAAILKVLRHQQEQMKVTPETFAKAEIHPHRVAVFTKVRPIRQHYRKMGAIFVAA